MLSTGQLLADRYRLSRRIAVGGMGEVWAAQDSRLDRDVAIKVLKAELSGDPEFLHRFRTEARTTASLNHPGVAAVHDYGETASVPPGPEDTAYLVMELVDGEPLVMLISKHGRMSVEFTLDVLEQSARALQAAHENGLVHRDVKPGNIMVASKPGGEIAVKLTDFGIAKAAHAAPVTRSGMVMGTAHYIAPEQATGAEAGPVSDVYSLAVCGYECLAGRRPFLSDHAVTVAMQHIRDMPPPLPVDVPPSVRALIEIAMVKDPRQRYGCGGEFAAAIAAVRAGHPAPAPVGFNGAPTQVMGGHPSTQLLPAGPPSGPHTGPYQQLPPYPAPRKSKAWLWVLLVLVVAAALVIGGFALTSGRHNQSPGVPAPSVQQPTPTTTTQRPEPTTTTTQQRQPTTEQQTTSTTEPASGPTVNGADYMGKPVDSVARDLESKGLRSKAFTLSRGKPKNPHKCLVIEMSPQGQLPEGTRVDLTCVEAPG